MPMQSDTAKITQRGAKKKQQIAAQAVKKSGRVDMQTVQKKTQARLKKIKQAR
jgi:hypothetical protein